MIRRPPRSPLSPYTTLFRSHALRAARAGLALQRAADEIAASNEAWPRFRVGVNSGEAIVGVVGERGHRIHGVFGDTVNLGAQIGRAPPELQSQSNLVCRLLL